MSDDLSIASATFTIGDWVPSSHSLTQPPHYLTDDPRHPNELSVVWDDERHTQPVAVEDWDGCRAAVLAEVKP